MRAPPSGTKNVYFSNYLQNESPRVFFRKLSAPMFVAETRFFEILRCGRSIQTKKGHTLILRQSFYHRRH